MFAFNLNIKFASAMCFLFALAGINTHIIAQENQQQQESGSEETSEPEKTDEEKKIEKEKEDLKNKK